MTRLSYRMNIVAEMVARARDVGGAEKMNMTARTRQEMRVLA